MVVAEPRELSVPVITSRGVVTGTNLKTMQEQISRQVWKTTQKKVSFDIQKQKQVFMDVRPDFMNPEEPSTSEKVRDMPEWFQHIFQKKVPQKVSKLKSFLSSFLALIQDKDDIKELQELIEETPVEPQPEKRVN